MKIKTVLETFHNYTTDDVFSQHLRIICLIEHNIVIPAAYKYVSIDADGTIQAHLNPPIKREGAWESNPFSSCMLPYMIKNAPAICVKVELPRFV